MLSFKRWKRIYDTLRPLMNEWCFKPRWYWTPALNDDNGSCYGFGSTWTIMKDLSSEKATMIKDMKTIHVFRICRGITNDNDKETVMFCSMLLCLRINAKIKWRDSCMMLIWSCNNTQKYKINVITMRIRKDKRYESVVT